MLSAVNCCCRAVQCCKNCVHACTSDTTYCTLQVKDTKREKKKKQTMSLTEFMKGGTSSRPSDDDILMSLPTKPRERAPGEAPPERGLGGGFGRDYGGRECSSRWAQLAAWGQVARW